MDNELYIEIPPVSKQQSQAIDTDTRIVELMKQGYMTFSYFQILYENGEHNCPGALLRHWMAINCLDCQNQTATCWIKERMNDKSFVEYLHAHLKRPYFACEKGRLFDSLSERLNSELSKRGVHVKCKQRGVQNGNHDLPEEMYQMKSILEQNFDEIKIMFIWPEIDQIKNMSYEELVRFEHEVATTCDFKQKDICSHYNKNFRWFSAMKYCRKNGVVPFAVKSEYRSRRMIELQRQLAVSRIDKWTDAEIRAFKFVYALDKYSLPRNTRLINLVLGTTIKAHTNYDFSRMLKTGSPTINRFITDTTITEMYDDVVVYVDKLIDLANEILNGCRSRFTRFIFIELGISQPPRHTLTRDAYVKLHNFIVRLNNIRGERK